MKPEHDKATVAEYREALLVQDACNLSGVVHSFSRWLGAMAVRQGASGWGTKAKRDHPISVLYASKIASLTGCESGLRFDEAFIAAEHQAAVGDQQRGAVWGGA